MPIDLAAVNWLYVIILAVFVFVTSWLGNVLSFSHRGMAALLSAVLFAGAFVFWTYYPHHLPLPTMLTAQKAAAPAAPTVPAAPAAPARPRNPVTDITPPKNPVTDITPSAPAR
jgi:hypothetical protein